MADKETKETQDRGGKESRAARREARTAKRAGKTNQDDSGRPTRLCTLGRIEVKKDNKGYQIIANGKKRHAISAATNEVGAVLRDLEAAIYVIRADAGSTG